MEGRDSLEPWSLHTLLSQSLPGPSRACFSEHNLSKSPKETLRSSRGWSVSPALLSFEQRIFMVWLCLPVLTHPVVGVNNGLRNRVHTLTQEPLKVTLFGKWVTPDVIKSRILR